MFRIKKHSRPRRMTSGKLFDLRALTATMMPVAPPVLLRSFPAFLEKKMRTFLKFRKKN